MTNFITGLNTSRPTHMPRHVGIIMDGNGRWAAARGLARIAGHKKGSEVFGNIVRHAKAKGIPFLTVYAFSTENWSRPPDEVKGIMSLLESYLRDSHKYRKENIKTIILGDKTPLSPKLRDMIAEVEQGSSQNTGITVNIALNYGGRSEIVHAARKAAQKLLDGELSGVAQIDEDFLAGCMYTAGQPDPDLVIRTGGEKRISNFLLWQSAYTEFVFTDTFWPDFTPACFDAALTDFAGRKRRKGGVMAVDSDASGQLTIDS